VNRRALFLTIFVATVLSSANVAALPADKAVTQYRRVVWT
jgi:hypothetical protein